MSQIGLFADYRIVQDLNNHITIPDGTKVKVTHMGTVNLPNGIVLRNVMYVPCFEVNLIYVHKLCTFCMCHVLSSILYMCHVLSSILNMCHVLSSILYMVFTNDKCIIQGQHNLTPSLVLGRVGNGDSSTCSW